MAGQTVLIVDDNELNRKLLRMQLEAEGYAAVEAADGVEALERLSEKHSIDAVITDVLMPRLDGYRLSHKIRADERLKTLPIIIQSATHASPADERLALDVGADRFCTRPGPAKMILDALKEVMSQPRPSLPRGAAPLDETGVMKEYSAALVSKLKENNAALERRNHELEALQEISRIILTVPDIHAAMESILDCAIALGAYDIGIVRLYDPATKILAPEAWRGYRDPRNVQRHAAGMRGALVHRVMSLKEPLVETDVPRIAGFRTWKSEGVHSAAIVPARAGDAVLGVLQLGSRARREFPPEEIRLLGSIGDQVGIAVQKARAQEAIKRSLKRIGALREIDKAITSTLDLNSILGILLSQIDLFFPFSGAVTVELIHSETGRLEPVTCRNLDFREWAAHQRSAASSPSQEAFEANGAVEMRDLQEDRRFHESDFYARHQLVSYLGAPLRAKGERLGVLSVYTYENHPFSSEEIEFLNTLADQAAIAIHNARLFDRIRKQTEELRQSNRIKSEFLSVVSHELRTPLNVIMGYTSVIEDDLGANPDPSHRQGLRAIATQSRKMLEMIDRIMDAAQIHSGNVEVVKQPVNMDRLTAELQAMYWGSNKKDLVLSWQVPREMPCFASDHEKLKQILRILIDNAIKFTERGTVGVRCRVSGGPSDESAERMAQAAERMARTPAGSRQIAAGSPHNPQSALRTPQSNNPQSAIRNPQFEGRPETQNPKPETYIEFSVADTGVGIPPESLRLIFEMFRQADSSNTRLFEGVGLGLYLAKEYTELLGGTISVESEVGKGSTFTVRVPAG
jgi:signal transduction histidine kinase/CheY-like chemotaxis protein